MYFPADMNFQYFFFTTYPGYFLQALPIALLAGALYWLIRYHGKKREPTRRRVGSVLFVCYLTGLICLTLLLDVMGDVWYRLLYHMDSGRTLRFFEWSFNFVPRPSEYLHSAESIANFILFLPFGVLYPLSKAKPRWSGTLAAGFVCSVCIELLQPVFGRSFDIDDIILNVLGTAVSATVFFLVYAVSGKRRRRR